MNSSEQKQVYLLGRMLFRDAEQVQALIDNDKLKVPAEASEFTQEVIRLGHSHVSYQDVRTIYEQTFSTKPRHKEYEKVAEIFGSQLESLG